MARTIDDWVALAAAAPTHAERDECLAAAGALASSAWDWKRLCEKAHDQEVGSPEWRRGVVDRLLERSIAERDHSGARYVARERARTGDPEGAREALESAVAAFDPKAPAYTWTALAQAFVELLDDREAARACLDLSRNPDPRSRCDVATSLVELFGARDEAVALLGALRPADASEAWPIANAWKTLGEPDRVREVLDTALAEARDLRGVLTVARAWHSHDLPSDAARVVDVAASEATSTTEWLDVAETALDLGLHDRVRPAIERAEAAEPLDEALRARVSAAWLWSGDAERAAAVGDRGVRPDALATVERTLPGFAPSASAWFDALRARFTEAMLRDVAGADYGMGYDKHLAALRDIVATGLVPRTMAWEPGEVVHLRRWSDGDGVDHVERALCATLCLLEGNDGYNDAPILVESAVTLGEPDASLAEALLAWLYVTSSPDCDTKRLSALWALALLCAARDPDDPRLEVLATLADETVAQRTPFDEIVRYCVRGDLWRALSDRYFDPSRPVGARWRALVG